MWLKSTPFPDRGGKHLGYDANNYNGSAGPDDRVVAQGDPNVRFDSGIVAKVWINYPNIITGSKLWKICGVWRTGTVIGVREKGSNPFNITINVNSGMV